MSEDVLKLRPHLAAYPIISTVHIITLTIRFSRIGLQIPPSTKDIKKYVFALNIQIECIIVAIVNTVVNIIAAARLRLYE